MNVLDTLTLWGRRYEQQRQAGSGGTHFGLSEVLEMFDRNLIMQLSTVVDGKESRTVRPDAVRKLKVSLLDDGISAIGSGSAGWYEVFRTPPTGDTSKVRIVAHDNSGQKLGEIRMLVGRRTYDHYFAEDPIFRHLQSDAKQN